MSNEGDLKGGKKVLKFLPENFFEKVLDLELKLKREFHLSILEELINLYSIAIEYYESNNNQKHMDYQTRLKLLLSQPEILKKMNKEKMKSKLLLKIELQNKDKLLEINPNRILQLQEKKYIINNYKTKVNSIGNSDNQVTELMTNYSKEVKIGEIINNEINKQESEFKNRLEEKRKSRVLGPLFQFDKNSSHSPMRLHDKSGLISSSNAEDNKSQNADTNNELNQNNEANNNSFGNDKSDMDLSANNIMNENEKILDNIDDIFEKINNDNNNDEIKLPSEAKKHFSMFNMDHSKIFENFDENKIIGTKNKKMIVSIKYSTESFLTGFNGYFHQNVFQKFTEHIEKLMDEKYKKYLEISKHYNTQIKEMEFLANSDENQHSESIKDIISSLKEEQQHEFDRIEDYYGNLIKDAQNNFKIVGFRNNQGIQILEEKFKLDIYNLIKDTLDTSKK